MLFLDSPTDLLIEFISVKEGNVLSIFAVSVVDFV